MPELIFVQARQSPQRILDVFARVLTRHELNPTGQNRHGFKSRQPKECIEETFSVEMYKNLFIAVFRLLFDENRESAAYLLFLTSFHMYRLQAGMIFAFC